jgi:hypothetical protein
MKQEWGIGLLLAAIIVAMYWIVAWVVYVY